MSKILSAILISKLAATAAFLQLHIREGSACVLTVQQKTFLSFDLLYLSILNRNRTNRGFRNVHIVMLFQQVQINKFVSLNF